MAGMAKEILKEERSFNFSFQVLRNLTQCAQALKVSKYTKAFKVKRDVNIIQQMSKDCFQPNV